MTSARGATPAGQSAVSLPASHCASACCPLPESTTVTRSALAEATRTSRSLAPFSMQTVPSATGMVDQEKAARGLSGGRSDAARGAGASILSRRRS